MKSKQIYGVLAEFQSTSEIYHACEKIRDTGFKKWDAHTPFPIHGLEKAMGLGQSKLPWIVGTMAFLGFSGAVALQVWINVFEYPYIYSGKPLFAWPAFVPVTFELSVLLGAFGAVFGMLALNRLPQHYHSVFNSDRFIRASDDTFFIAIESTDPKFDSNKTPLLLKELGAKSVEFVEL